MLRHRRAQCWNLREMTHGPRGQVARCPVCKRHAAIVSCNKECGTRGVEQSLQVLQLLFSIGPRSTPSGQLTVASVVAYHPPEDLRDPKREKYSGTDRKERRRVVVRCREQPGCDKGKRAYAQRAQRDDERKAGAVQWPRVHALPCVGTAPRDSNRGRRPRTKCFPELFAAPARSRPFPAHRVALIRLRDAR